MNKLELALYNTRDSVLDYSFDSEYNDYSISEILQCSHCGIWLRYKELKLDLDKHEICDLCLRFEGM